MRAVEAASNPGSLYPQQSVTTYWLRISAKL